MEKIIIKKKRQKTIKTRLSRDEMWNGIILKFPSLETFVINSTSSYNSNLYRNRDIIFMIFIELKVHKSRHITKFQKQRVEYEVSKRVLEKL